MTARSDAGVAAGGPESRGVGGRSAEAGDAAALVLAMIFFVFFVLIRSVFVRKSVLAVSLFVRILLL